MENPAQEKMESLMKYVPFIDFVLEIDKEKYIKFINIRKWIILRKKKYPLSDLNKIEQSIITQYKNLLIENNVQIPENITKVFAPMIFKDFVNLCSDDEEEDVAAAKEVIKRKDNASSASKKSKPLKEHNERNKKYSKAADKADDSDDDLEIVSIDYVKPKNETQKNKNSTSSREGEEFPKQDPIFDDISKNILSKIDKLTEDDIKQKNRSVYEPINYTYQEKDFCDITEDNSSEPIEEKEIIFQRRSNAKTSDDGLFKRRTDFKDEIQENENSLESKQQESANNIFDIDNEPAIDLLQLNVVDDEVEVQHLESNNKTKHFTQKPIETISLDSCSEDEDDNQPSTSKAAALKARLGKKLPSKVISPKESISNENEKENSNSNCKVELLCNSIDSAFSNDCGLMEELNEINKVEKSNPKPSQKEISETNSDKENTSLQAPNATKTNNLSQEQIRQLLADMSNKTDFDMDIFNAALSYVKQMNSPSTRTKTSENNSISPAVTETPPPAPPPVNNLNSSPVQPLQQQQQPQQQPPFVYNINQPNVCYSQTQQTQHLNPPLTPCYPQNATFLPTPGVLPPAPSQATAPPRPKISINDPRIVKQLQAIQNSPLFTYNVLNPEIADNIMQICQSQKFQPQPQQPTNFQQNNKSTHSYYNNTNNLRKSNDTAPTTSSSSSITYGEYKRRQQEQKLQLERLREEEKRKAEQLELEKKKKDEEIRSKLLSTLTPCTEQLTTMWSQQKNLTNNTGAVNKSNIEKENVENSNPSLAAAMCSPEKNLTNNSAEVNKSAREKENPIENVQNNPPPSSSATVENNAKENTTTKQKEKVNKRTKSKNKKEKGPNHSKSSKQDQRFNRIYKELKCTVKGFDQLHDYISNIEEKTESNDSNKTTDTSSRTEAAFTPRPIGLRRRSSLHALTAITEQLGQQSSDYSDSDVSQKRGRRPSSSSSFEPNRHSVDSHYNPSSENMSEDTMQSFPKRRKTIDEVIKPNKRTKALRIADDESSTTCSSSEDENISKKSKENPAIHQPVIKLRRMSQDFIRKHTEKRKEETEKRSRLKKNCEKVLNPVEPAQKTNKLKRYNNDCQMTERNTLFCVLCKSKPSDLANHYIGRHKTESYVARLDWAELDDLSINTPFAKLQPKTKNSRFDRYEVDCPFCKDKIVDQFINLYQHYSIHTGEYAFQCTHCNLTKPYRPDIQSHILHSKTCRNATTQVMYRYPPNAQCIYLHCCTICNFVQLNEANVLKHLREHHDSSKAIASNVQKYILVAMSDGPDVSETNKPPTPAPTPPTPAATPPPTQPKETAVDNNVNMTCKINLKAVQLPVVQRTMSTSNDLESSSDFKVDDDDIPVSNEPCCEEEFLEEGKYSLEEQLKQLHEGTTTNVNTQIQPPPMTVIHCMGDQLKQSPSVGLSTIPNTRTQPPSDRHLPMIIKTELNMDVEENLLQTPPRPKCRKANEVVSSNIPAVARPQSQSTTYEKYRNIPPNVNYLGLYKCMIDDCYYSTDCPEEFCKHITDHSTTDQDSNSIESYLQCPYCVIITENLTNPMQLVEHVRSQHEKLIYQCSMCCYRSCDASNVYCHQQLHHNSHLDLCKIYKCTSSDDESNISNGLDADLNEQIVKNVFQIVCSVCKANFYHTQLLIEHLNSVHKVNMDNSLKIYSCVYCTLMVQNRNEIRFHLATKHPDKQPYIYDHNTLCNGINEDLLRLTDSFCASETVAYEEITTAKENQNDLQDINDIKPDFKQLQQMTEETVRVRLRKLTAHTGVQPDKLYRCPHTACGGFFSIFDLWLRHMRVRHQCLECECPHCPTPKFLTVEQFALHFEGHRRHTIICYYCSSTWPNKTLALKHASEKHSDLGSMRFEQIRFNLTYSYAIMIQSDLLKDHDSFLAEFLLILDKRLKDLETIDREKLKHQWPVPEDTLWVEDYLPLLLNRKVVRTCLIRGCPFRTVNENDLFAHLRSSHVIAGTLFNCSKCKYSLPVCSSFDEVIDHIKLHNEFICICVACNLSTSSRQKMSTHIRAQHSARDVPVIQLFKTNQQLFIKLFIVFADNCLTFSTMKKCFCCPEKNMEGDVFTLHLKRYHKFSLDYYCEQCPDIQFKSLKDVKSHFQQLHSMEALKVRCELASANDLRVTALNDIQVEILKGVQTPLALHIKDEPIDVTNNEDNDDDDVILLEDNDIVIQDSLRDEQVQQPKIVPKLKCASFSNLIEPTIAFPANVPEINQQYYQQLPQTTSISMNSISAESSSMPSTYLPVNQRIYQTSTCPTVSNTQFMGTTSSYENNMNPSNNFNPTITQNGSTNNFFIQHNNTITNQAGSVPTIRKIRIHPTTNSYYYMDQPRMMQQVPVNTIINQNNASIPSLNVQNNVYHNS